MLFRSEEAEQARLAAEEAEHARLAAEEAEQARLAAEEAEQARLAAEEAEARLAAEEAEQARLAAEEAEQARLAAEEAERERLAAEEAERARLAAEEAEQARLAAEEAEQARLAAEEAEHARLAAEEAERERLAAEEAERARLAAEEAERERLAAEEAEQARLAAEEAEHARLAAEEAEQARLAAEEAERERLAAEEAEQARLAAEEAEQARLAAEEAERERLAAEEAEQARLAAEEAERARLAAEEAERARLAAEEAERERLAPEEAEHHRSAFEEAERLVAEEDAEQARLAAEEQTSRDLAPYVLDRPADVTLDIPSPTSPSFDGSDDPLAFLEVVEVQPLTATESAEWQKRVDELMLGRPDLATGDRARELEQPVDRASADSFEFDDGDDDDNNDADGDDGSYDDDSEYRDSEATQPRERVYQERRRRSGDHIREDMVQSLIAACRGGYEPVVRGLIAKGVLVNAKDDRGTSALHVACKFGQIDVCKLLLESDAKVDVQDTQGRTPLHYACHAGEFDVAVELIRKYTSQGADGDASGFVGMADYQGATALHNAASSGQCECMDLLLQKQASVHQHDDANQTALHTAALAGQDYAIDILLFAKASIDVIDQASRTPLHLAAMSGSPYCIELLRENHAPVLVQDQQGLTPLHLACLNSNDHVAELLLQPPSADDEQEEEEEEDDDDDGDDNDRDGDGDNKRSSDRKKTTRAPTESQPDRTQELLALTDYLGRSALHAAAAAGSTACVTALLEARANLAAIDADGYNVLHWAVRGVSFGEQLRSASLLHPPDDEYENERLACLDYLLSRNATVSTDRFGRSPLHHAIAFGHMPQCIDMLVQSGCDVNLPDSDGRVALHFITSTTTVDHVQSLVSVHGASALIPDRLGITPVHVAAARHNAAVLSFLLSPSLLASPNCEGLLLDCYSRSPMHLVAATLVPEPSSSTNPTAPVSRANLAQTVRVLADSGIPHLHHRDKHGRTPLHAAARVGNVTWFNAVSHLIVADDLLLLDRHGRTPLSTAAAHRQAPMVSAILGLLRSTATPSVLSTVLETTDRFGRTPLHYATDAGCVSAVQQLLQAGADSNAADIHLNTPLHLVAASAGRPVNPVASYDRDCIASDLIGTSASIRAQNHLGLTPLHVACHHQAADLIPLLLSTEVTYTEDQQSVLDIRANDGAVALHYAAARPCVKAINMILEADCCPPSHTDVQDSLGRTPLALAASLGHDEAVITLLEGMRDTK